MMRLAEPGDWGTMITDRFSGVDRSRRVRSMTKPDTTKDGLPRGAATSCCAGRPHRRRTAGRDLASQSTLWSRSMRLHAAPNVQPCRVIVGEDGEVVADGRLSDLIRTDGEEAENVDIFVHPDDVEGFCARWFEGIESNKGGLN
jgi:hypothetical protein